MLTATPYHFRQHGDQSVAGLTLADRGAISASRFAAAAIERRLARREIPANRSNTLNAIALNTSSTGAGVNGLNVTGNAAA